MKKIKNIVIVGGGSSAWLAAAYLSHSFKFFDITVVDKEIGNPVGVGEGTILNFGEFLNRCCGFDQSEWLPKIDATIKLGILFPGWVNEDNIVWHPFLLDVKSEFDMRLHDLWSRNQHLDFKQFGIPLFDSAIRNDKVDVQTTPYAYHINAGKLVTFIQSKLQNKINFIKSEMVSINRLDDNSIHSIVLKDGQKIEGDLFLDCTGFKGLLNNNPDRNDLSGRLICDTAVAGHIPYANRDEELHPYVISEAVDCGWIWNIPVNTRIGSGLVFNRSVTDPGDAKKLFCDYWDNRITPDKLKVIDWTPYYNNNIWHENVVSIGLSAGFIEPLESTGLALIIEGILQLGARLSDRTWNNYDKEIYNNMMTCFFEESIDFVSMHYAKTERNSPFWQTVRDTIKISEKQRFYTDWLADPALPMPQGGKDSNFFTAPNWTIWLVQMGYPVAPRDLGQFNEVSEHEIFRYFDIEESRRTVNGVKHNEYLDCIYRDYK
jgi:Tryptophan halogenase